MAGVLDEPVCTSTVARTRKLGRGRSEAWRLRRLGLPPREPAASLVDGVLSELLARVWDSLVPRLSPLPLAVAREMHGRMLERSANAASGAGCGPLTASACAPLAEAAARENPSQRQPQSRAQPAAAPVPPEAGGVGASSGDDKTGLSYRRWGRPPPAVPGAAPVSQQLLFAPSMGSRGATELRQRSSAARPVLTRALSATPVPQGAAHGKRRVGGGARDAPPAVSAASGAHRGRGLGSAGMKGAGAPLPNISCRGMQVTSKRGAGS